ncbi:MAG: hypothetical protein CMH52_04585 [Myxococcales bacterium]|nr:hypothetical protein [Myxococcales bacterium]
MDLTNDCNVVQKMPQGSLGCPVTGTQTCYHNVPGARLYCSQREEREHVSERIVVFSSLQAVDVHLVRSVLTREGIPSFIRSQHISPLVGEVPVDEARVELYVFPQHLDSARQVIDDAVNQDGPDWVCEQCGEVNPCTFEVCWSCQNVPSLSVKSRS